MRKKTIGIYYIVNNLNGKYYIGSSKNIEQRFTHHRYKLRCNKHTSHYLQRAWNKHGKDNFSFVVICELLPTTDKSYLNELEQYFLDNADYENVYNLAKIVGRPPERDMRKEKHPRYGMHTPEHQKQAISLAVRKSGSGIKKVANRYEVTFCIKGTLTYLGSRQTYQDALELRLAAEKKYWSNDDSIVLPSSPKRELTGKEGIKVTKYNTYIARAKKEGKNYHIGTFKTFQEAYEARQEALQKIFQGD
jgi:group I intron endonuclease